MGFKIIPTAKVHIEDFNKALGVVAREKRYITIEKKPPLAKTRGFLKEVIKKGYPQLVAMDGDKLAGWCDIIPGSKPTTKHVGNMGVILLPEYRGQGLGEKLIKATIKVAKKKGVKRVELGVVSDNRNAISLYLKLGFEVEGLKKKDLLLDGEYKDCIMMAKFV